MARHSKLRNVWFLKVLAVIEGKKFNNVVNESVDRHCPQWAVTPELNKI